MKNKGFSLIEVCIGIALVAVMVGIGGPKIRSYVASGKDTKALSILATLRTASELYYSENGTPIWDGNEDSTVDSALAKLSDYVDQKTLNSVKDGKIEIGGYIDEENQKTYGGEMALSFTNPDSSGEKGDGVYIWFAPEEGQKLTLKGKKWSEF